MKFSLAIADFVSYLDSPSCCWARVDCVRAAASGRGNRLSPRRGSATMIDRRLAHNQPSALPPGAKKSNDQLPKTPPCNLRFEITVPGFAPRLHSRHHAVSIPALSAQEKQQKIGKALFPRWNVELHFRQIKTCGAWMSALPLTPRWF